VLSNGEKVVPNVMESKMSSSPLLAGALMFGNGKPHCGLLIEARKPMKMHGWEKDFVNEIWCVIFLSNFSHL
jgi:long-subunit acyl-CoA synthetase (AMP-forming)